MFDALKRAFAKSSATGPVPRPSSLNEPVAPLSYTIRDTLFGDDALPDLLARISPAARVQEPWFVFARAVDSPPADAITALESLTGSPDSRVRLLAWHALRAHGVQPPPEFARQVLGVVVEAAVNGGLDLVAVYPEHAARYYNYAGGGVVWEGGTPEKPELMARMDALLAAGGVLAQAIGLWDKPRPAPPTAGRVRLNILTPGGLMFGEGPMNVMAQDKLGGPVFRAALDLMRALMDVSKEQKDQRST